ncbi:MAG: hypothetical protein NWT00_09380 [Beijerinckiaceae bacterium]|jgi:hypothetical protein|nr:hypothetical protein [Beijerinckiaceae bacterium]
MGLWRAVLEREPGRPLIVRKHDRALTLAHKGLDRFAEAARSQQSRRDAAE